MLTREMYEATKRRDELLAHTNRPSGSMDMQYVGWSLRISMAVSCETVVMVTKATMGLERSSPSWGDDENRNWRVTLWAPSAPIIRVPSSTVPSVNVAVTPVGVVVSECRLFPN